MNFKSRYEEPIKIFHIIWKIYLIAIFSGLVLTKSNFELNEDSLFWTTSTIIQAFGALLALSAVYSIYRIQNYEKDLDNSKNKIIFLIIKKFHNIRMPIDIKFKSRGVEVHELISDKKEIEILKYTEHNEFIETIKKYLEDINKEIGENKGGIEEYCYHIFQSVFNEYNETVIRIKEYKKSTKYSLYLIGTDIIFALIFLPHFTFKSSNSIVSFLFGESVVILFLIFFSAYCLLELILSIKSSIGE